MKKLPEVNLSCEGLYKMLIAPIRSKLLLTGIELKVFNVLSELKPSKDVARAIGTHPSNTRVFLDSLVAIDLLHKKNGLYRNSPIAQAFLVENSPTYLGRLLTFMKPDDQFLQNLPQLVREGPPPPPEKPSFSEEALVKGVELIADAEKVGYVQEAVNILLELPEFPSFQKMLDLGGGPGLIGMAIVDLHPKMKGVIFDLPLVVKEAKKFIEEYEMEDRMEVLGGDFNRDSIGEGYDLVWASGVFQFVVDIDSVVKKVHDALNPSGVFVSLMPFGRTHEGTKPESTVLSNFMFHSIKFQDRTQLIAEALRVLRDGGAFAFQDLFNDEYYSDDFLDVVKSWGLKEVNFVDSSDYIHIPIALRFKHMTGGSGILYGIK